MKLKARPAAPIDAENMLENATDGFLVYDSEFHFTYLNADSERLLGKSKAEVLGKTHWEVFPETIGTEIERHYRLVMWTGLRVLSTSSIHDWRRGSRCAFRPHRWGACWSGCVTSRRAATQNYSATGFRWRFKPSGRSLPRSLRSLSVAISVMRSTGFYLRAGQSRVPGTRTQQADPGIQLCGDMGGRGRPLDRSFSGTSLPPDSRSMR